MQKKIIPTEELKHALSHIATIKISEIGLSEADELDYLLEPYYKDDELFSKISALCNEIIDGNDDIKIKKELKTLCRSLF